MKNKISDVSVHPGPRPELTLGFLITTVLAGTLGTRQVAADEIVYWDTSALASLSTCNPSDCSSGKNPRYQYDQEGLPGALSASAATSDAYGTATAYATIGSAAADGAPILGASASSSPGYRNLGTAAALQSFTYNGIGPATRVFGGMIDYTQTVTGSYPAALGNGVDAVIDVFTLPTGAGFNAGVTAIDNLNALLNNGAQAGYAEVATNSYTDALTNLNGHAFFGATVSNLQIGQTYWVLAILQAPGTNGGTTNASDTFTTGWFDTNGTTDSSGLTSATTVPLPAAAWLMLSGLGGLGVLARRR